MSASHLTAYLTKYAENARNWHHRMESRPSHGVPTWAEKEVKYTKRHSQVTLTWTTAGPNIGCKCKENIEIEAALFL